MKKDSIRVVKWRITLEILRRDKVPGFMDAQRRSPVRKRRVETGLEGLERTGGRWMVY